MKGDAFLCIAWNPWIKKKRLYIIIAVLYFKQMDWFNNGPCVLLLSNQPVGFWLQHSAQGTTHRSRIFSNKALFSPLLFIPTLWGGIFTSSVQKIRFDGKICSLRPNFIHVRVNSASIKSIQPLETAAGQNSTHQHSSQTERCEIIPEMFYISIAELYKCCF